MRGIAAGFVFFAAVAGAEEGMSRDEALARCVRYALHENPRWYEGAWEAGRRMGETPGGPDRVCRAGVWVIDEFLGDDERAAAGLARTLAEFTPVEDRVEFADRVKAMLAERHGTLHPLGLELLDRLELGPHLLEAAFAAMEDEDVAVGCRARDAFEGCRDPEVLGRLRERALRADQHSWAAVGALHGTGDPDQEAWLLALAADAGRPADLRGTAIWEFAGGGFKPAAAEPALVCLKSADPDLQYRALHVLKDGRVRVPLDLLRSLRLENYGRDVLRQAKALSGDAEAARQCIELGLQGRDEEWEYAALSGCREIREDFERAVRETGDLRRQKALPALGLLGQPESFECIARFLDGPNQIYTAEWGLGRLVAKRPELMQRAADEIALRLANGKIKSESFVWYHQQDAKGKQVDELVTAYLQAAGKHRGCKEVWEGMRAGLKRVAAGPKSGESLEDWEEWWEELLRSRH
jgi:hypothetical protein